MKEKIKKQKEVAEDSMSCKDEQCPIHGELAARGRVFEGYVIKKFPRRIAIEFERTILIRKYDRYMKKKTKLHARLPGCMKDEVELGDYVQIQETRPLSKIIHFVLVKVLRKKQERK